MRFFHANSAVAQRPLSQQSRWHFTDVTEKAGVAGGGYGMGVAAGDYEGDGFPDLYVRQYGRNIFYRNNGDGTFSDVTEKAGVGAAGWSSSAVWFDYDNDGGCTFSFANSRSSTSCSDAAWTRTERTITVSAHLQAPL